MNKNGDIIVIEDDEDDRQLLIDLFEEITTENNYENRLVIIDDSTTAYQFLKSEECDPFIILSDINMPKMDGFTLRNLIFSDEELKERSIPFIFLTTLANNEKYIKEAYQMSIQGFFSKPANYADYKKMLASILSYWKQGLTP
jgi:CheY-like chemotaxis protein